MTTYSSSFEKEEWNTETIGRKYKTIHIDNKKMTLVEFNDEFVEPDWCAKGHFGYVIEGKAKVCFINGKEIHLNVGDVINIPSGEKDKHKTKIEKGKNIIVLFIDQITE